MFKRIDSMVQYSMVCITLFQRLEAEWAGVVEKKRFFIKNISIVQCLCYANCKLAEVGVWTFAKN